MGSACFRFYAELNFFVAPHYRRRPFEAECARDASAKHMIEALGVPHTEVELILANGEPVDFSYRLQGGDRISVFPYFCSLSGEPAIPGSLRLEGESRFIADSHLGRLARDLRMLGFDVLYRNDFSDAEIAVLACEEERIVLTRDRDLLIRKTIRRGCYLHAQGTGEQLHEVMRRYRLAGKARPLTRCLGCNGVLADVDRALVMERLPQASGVYGTRFFACLGCEQVYWDGSHATRMRKRVLELLDSPYTANKRL